MLQVEMDQNLIVVAAVEGYSIRHKVEAKEVFKLFQKYDIIKLLRTHYQEPHTQNLDESVSFAEDILSRRM